MRLASALTLGSMMSTAVTMMSEAVPAAAQSIAPPGATACSGCHGPGTPRCGRSSASRPPLGGHRCCHAGLPNRPASGNGHGSHRQGLYGRGNPRHCILAQSATLRGWHVSSPDPKNASENGSRGAAAAAFPRRTAAQTSPRVVVVGGGFGGPHAPEN